MTILAEYIWIDGVKPTAGLRSKTKVLRNISLGPATLPWNGEEIPLDDFPAWGADGSSTSQADGADSDIGLVPVRAIPDPFRPGGYLVLCEVCTGDGELHPTNSRAKLRAVLDAGGGASNALVGFEQEYTFMNLSGTPLGFPLDGFPRPQGPYYCAVGAENIIGRDIYETFMEVVLTAGLTIGGFNWEVMPGQAEFQVGALEPLTCSDQVWLARWIIQRVAEDFGVVVSLDAKPAKGDWNGAGMHVNFSTAAMREEGGLDVIEKACAAIGERRQAHLDVYGHLYEERLTGAHETCSYREFRWGVADRTSSIRIPRQVASEGKGYLEDRRPNANADPYEVSTVMLQSVLGL